MSDQKVQNEVEMNRGGRPQIAEENRRKILRSFRFTETEDRALRDQADAAGLSVSEYLRQTALASALATETLSLPLSAEDKKLINLNAIEAGYDFRGYVMEALKNLRRPPFRDEQSRKDKARTLMELNRIGINLDQCLYEHRIPKKDKPAFRPVLNKLTAILEKIASDV